MKKKKQKQELYKFVFILLRIFTGMVFLVASIDKIINPEIFANLVNNYKILPYPYINIFAIILPWIEALSGLFLITGFWPKGSILIYNSFMIIFIIALSSVLYRNLDISCGCFTISPDADKDIIHSLIRDIFLLIPGIILLSYEYYKQKVDQQIFI